MRQGVLPAATRVGAGEGLGPLPAHAPATPLARTLARHGRSAADPARNFGVEIEEGLLICAGCGRWYPIIDQLPEILPDPLRNAERDHEFLRTMAGALPADLRSALEAFRPARAAADDGGHYKTAEMSIAGKIDDPDFFGPGYSSPFNPLDPEFSLYLVSLFGMVARLLRLRKGETVVDSGSGYSWTTEWLHRSGIHAIGVDITRVYLDVAITRMGPPRPHLVIGDVEHLPLLPSIADAVLAYESFHHLPNRHRAMAGYDRVLREGGRVVLAEPGAEHEAAAVSVDVMQKYGILERGMELADVIGYASGTRLSHVEQIHVTGIPGSDAGRDVGPRYLQTRCLTEGHVFILKRGTEVASAKKDDEPPAEPVVKGSAFDAWYYAHSCGRPYARDEEWLRFFGTIADRIVTDIVPGHDAARVLDAGCALGLLVEALRARGIAADGLDISEYAISQVQGSARGHCRVASLTDDLPERYDLIVCIEVLEHMPPADAHAALLNLCRHADDVLFSSSPYDFGEATHVNVRPPEEWTELFAREGFLRDLDYDASYITPWAVRYRRRREPVPRIVREYERVTARVTIERNELRKQVQTFDRHVRAEAADAPMLREDLARANEALLAAQHRILVLEDTVTHMKRSVFWRLRELLRGPS